MARLLADIGLDVPYYDRIPYNPSPATGGKGFSLSKLQEADPNMGQEEAWQITRDGQPYGIVTGGRYTSFGQDTGQGDQPGYGKNLSVADQAWLLQQKQRAEQGMTGYGNNLSVEDQIRLLQARGQGTPSQFDYGKTSEGLQGGWENALDVTRLAGEQAQRKAELEAQNALDVAKQNRFGSEEIARLKALSDAESKRITGEFDLEMARRNAQSSELVAQINRDAETNAAQITASASMSNKEKDVQIADINRQAADRAAEMVAVSKMYGDELLAQAQQYQTEAQYAIAMGQQALQYAQTEADVYKAQQQIALGYEQMASAERIAQAKNDLDKEVAGLNAYVQLQGIQSQERASRAQSAVGIFQALAQATPANQLRNAFYFLRGEAPPPTLAESMPAGLFEAMGLSGPEVSGWEQQMAGQVNPPPFLRQLMAGVQ